MLSQCSLSLDLRSLSTVQFFLGLLTDDSRLSSSYQQNYIIRMCAVVVYILRDLCVHYTLHRAGN